MYAMIKFPTYVFASNVQKLFHSFTTPGLRDLSAMQEPIKKKHFLIVGLGNFGLNNTRHSVGMKAVDVLAGRLNIKWQRYDGFICSTKLDHLRLTLFKPKDLMNINGKSVSRIAHELSLSPSNIYLIHDELERLPGKFHLKEGGSAGGHNGVLSCMDSLRSKDMMRLRIGIGRPASKANVVSYVLSKFSKEEMVVVDTAIQQGLDHLMDHILKRTPNAAPEATHSLVEEDSSLYSQQTNRTTSKGNDKTNDTNQACDLTVHHETLSGSNAHSSVINLYFHNDLQQSAQLLQQNNSFSDNSTDCGDS